jgi:hypothetical protein
LSKEGNKLTLSKLFVKFGVKRSGIKIFCQTDDLLEQTLIFHEKFQNERLILVTSVLKLFVIKVGNIGRACGTQGDLEEGIQDYLLG